MYFLTLNISRIDAEMLEMIFVRQQTPFDMVSNRVIFMHVWHCIRVSVAHEDIVSCQQARDIEAMLF